MGNGKGNPEYYVAEIQPGKVLYEMDGGKRRYAREAFLLAAAKLPIATTFVQRLVARKQNSAKSEADPIKSLPVNLQDTLQPSAW